MTCSTENPLKLKHVPSLLCQLYQLKYVFLPNNSFETSCNYFSVHSFCVQIKICKSACCASLEKVIKNYNTDLPDTHLKPTGASGNG